jgi:N-acetyl-anhydromuramyl-L-alanine amidase AmpD
VTATINYDLKVKNLIDELSDTRHVTHKAYRKDSITFHHNAGRLSHEGVLSVWQTRPASAHFDVDRAGDACQDVKVNEYAWAVGNTDGNMRTISIEMANSSTGGDWPVSEVTWRAAARLAGWLFAKVMGIRPTKDNVFFHHHWSSTSCAGPYMDSVYDELLAAVQESYEHFKGSGATPAAPAPAPRPQATATAPRFPLPRGWFFGPESGPRSSVSGYHGYRSALMTWQRQMKARGWRISVDGFYGPQTEGVARAFQKEKGLAQDGKIGINTWSAAWTAPIT